MEIEVDLPDDKAYRAQLSWFRKRFEFLNVGMNLLFVQKGAIMEEEPSQIRQETVDISEAPIKRRGGKKTGNIRKKIVPQSAIARDAGTIFPVGIEKYLQRKGWKIEKFSVGKRSLILTISIPISEARFRTVRKAKLKKT